MPIYNDGFPAQFASDIMVARLAVQEVGVTAGWHFRTPALLPAPPACPPICQIRPIEENTGVVKLSNTFFEELPEELTTWHAGHRQLGACRADRDRPLDPGSSRCSVTGLGAACCFARDPVEAHLDGRVPCFWRAINGCRACRIPPSGCLWGTARSTWELTPRAALQGPLADDSVEAHLPDTKDELVLQHDAASCDRRCPTGRWRAEATTSALRRGDCLSLITRTLDAVVQAQ